MANGGRTLTLPWWYALAGLVVSVLLLGVSGVAYTNYALRQTDATERENDRRWCALLSTLDTSYKANPPQTETGRAVAKGIHDLRTALGCA